MSEPATIVACLTPQGAGAIAVIAVRGPRAWQVARELLRLAGKALPDAPEAGAVWFGHVGDGGVRDEVVLVVKQVDPAPWLELHCHGGRQVVEWLLQLLHERGLFVRSSAQFLDEGDPAAALWRALAHALTARTAAIILDQINGALDVALAEIRRGTKAV